MALVAILTLIIAGPAMVIALTESAPLVQTVCKPFVKRGGIGRAIGWFLYPSWPSGILFTILISLISLAAIFSHGMFDVGVSGTSVWGDEESVVILSLLGGILFPAVWQVFLFRGDGQRVAHYLLLLAGSFLMLGILWILAESMNSGAFLWFFAWNPLAFIAMLEESKLDDEVLLVGVIIVDLILLFILFARAMMDIRKCAPIIREAEISIENPG
jgi:hypothetical protein